MVYFGIPILNGSMESSMKCPWGYWGLSGLLFGLVGLSGCGGGGSASKPPTKAKWTILVYMNAANDLDIYSPINITQMQQAATNPDVRILVQWKQSTKVTPGASFNGTRRYLITHSTGNKVVSHLVQDLGTGVDMGIASSVNQFITWGKANFPADHIALILWDHGNGWLPSYTGAVIPPMPNAISYDGQTGHSIQSWQLNQALVGQHLDILSFDASLMQMAEVAYQIKDNVDYVVGSEESPPGAGYPYQTALGGFASNPDDSPRNLAKSFVDAMVNEPTYASSKIEQSVIDTSQMTNVAVAASSLQKALVANAGTIGAIMPQVRNNTQSYLQTSTRYFYDSVDLSNQISALSTNSAVNNACKAYATAVQNAVVWEGHNSHSPGSHGLSIDFSPSSYFKSVSTDYSKLSWSAAAGWSQWLTIAP